MRQLQKLLLIILISITPVFAHAQEGKLRGIILSEEGNVLPGITVQLKQAETGTITNNKGEFEFTAPIAGDTLIVQAVNIEPVLRTVKPTDYNSNPITIRVKTRIFDLGEVVVSASRVAESIDEVPSSVSVMTPREINAAASYSDNLALMLVNIPGMPLNSNKTSNRGQTLRGRNTLVLIDGIPQSTPLRNGNRDLNTIDPNVIERIEVIKGATAIYGNGADGGIINYITKKPEQYKTLAGKTTFYNGGSLSRIANGMSGGLSQQLTGSSDKVSYLFNGTYRQTGVEYDANGEVLSPTYGLGETSIYNLLGKIDVETGNKSSLSAMYNFYSSNQETHYVTEAGVYGESPAIGVLGEAGGDPQGNRYNHNAQLSYNRKDFFRGTNLDLSAYMQSFKTVFGYSPYFSDNVNGYEAGQSQIISDKLGMRVNLNTHLGAIRKGTDLIYGVDILNDITEQSLVDGRSWVPETDMTNMAPYLQIKSHLPGNFLLKGGLRYENIAVKVDDYSTIFLTPYGDGAPQGGVAVEGGTINYNALVFNIGVRYSPTPVFKPFASFSQSFSIADLGRTLRSATANTVQNISSEAVITDNYEAGFNSNLGKLQFSAAGYLSKSELGSSYEEVDGVFQIARQPEQVYGFEVEANYRLAPGLALGGSFSWIEGKFDSNDNGNVSDEEDAYINSDRIPPHKLILYTTYQSGRWNARLQGVFTGSRDHFDPSESGTYAYGQGPVDNINLVFLNAGYDLSSNVHLSLGIENLLNADYYTQSAQWQGRDTEYTKGNGIRYKMGLSYSF